MGKKKNIRIANLFMEALNSREPELAEAYYADDYQYEAPGAPGAMNLEQAQAYTQGFLEAFPDLHFEVRHRVAQGDFVVVNWIATGTHTGPLPTPTGATLPPTGNAAVVPGSTTYRFENGKAAQSWVFWDMATMLAQLGLMPGA